MCRTIHTFSASCLLIAIPFFVLNESAVSQQKEKLPEFEHPADLDPGDAGLLKTEKGMSYFLRIPKSYDSDKGTRLIVFMHGSNMSGLSD